MYRSEKANKAYTFEITYGKKYVKASLVTFWAESFRDAINWFVMDYFEQRYKPFGIKLSLAHFNSKYGIAFLTKDDMNFAKRKISFRIPDGIRSRCASGTVRRIS